ncbi:MAG: PAS domain S-box protein [Cyanobacteria bacterium P01_G01_bin.19]
MSSESILEECLARLSQESNSTILLVSKDNRLLHVVGESSQIFKPPGGRITTEVTKMVAAPLQLPLSTALHRARQQHRLIQYQGIKLEVRGNTIDVSLKVIPPQRHNSKDIAPHKLRQDDFLLAIVEQKISSETLNISQVENFELGSEASQRIIELEHELQQTRENLQALVEELETTNEEQQASNEELTASNEELQSTNEELHSVNEELHTVNVEYQSKIQELTQLNNDIDNLLKSSEIGVIFLDLELKIRKFTPAATQVISLRPTDIDRPLTDLTLKVDCPQLWELLQEGLTQKRSLEVEVKLRDKDSFFLMQINPYQAEDGNNEGLVVTFVSINEAKKVQLELEKTLTELKSREAEIANFFELSLEIICVASLDGCFKQINPSLGRILGYKTAELIDKPFLSLVHPDDVEITRQALKDLSQGKEITGLENRYRCQNGSYRWLRWMKISHEDIIYATARDFTAEKLAQELQNRQLAAIETATNGIAILNEDKFIYLNQAHLDIFGYDKPEELLGQSWRSLYDSKRLAQFEREIFPVLQDKGMWQGIVKSRHRKGHLFDEELTLSFASTGDLICVCQDITERLKMERSLIESEKKYRYLYENTPIMLHSIDSEDRIISVSKYWLKKMGYSSKEVIGKKSTDFLTPKSQKYARSVLPKFFRTGSCHNVFYQWVRKDGSVIDGLLSAISDIEEGKIVRSLAVVVDITEQQQKERLEETNRAKDNFIAHMSHELRTPLNSVLGFSKILKQDSSLSSKQLKTVDIINQSGQHLLTLINDVLDLSKLTAGKLELKYCNFNLVDFLQNTATIFQLRAREKGLDFVIKISADLPKAVNTDRTRLRQVLINLLSNSIKFTSTGRVTMSADCYEPDSASKLRTIRFQVEDTGRGIPKDKYETVFAPFGQVNQNSSDTEGTGLGLPICQNILSLMNSELHLDSTAGEGSRFWFDLNLEEVSATSLPPENLQPDLPVTRRLATPCKILIVDDNKDNRLLLAEYLQPLGFSLKEASNGREGIAIAEEFQPDAILVDLLMPVMDGKEMSDRIRQHSQLQHTVMLMISANIQTIHAASDIACNGFLVKPVDLSRLLEMLAENLKLDWQISLSHSQPESDTAPDNLITPSQEKLLDLLELVNFGNMDDLLEQIDLLEKADLQYVSFAENIRQLADDCQQEKLEALIKNLLKTANSN